MIKLARPSKTSCAGVATALVSEHLDAELIVIAPNAFVLLKFLKSHCDFEAGDVEKFKAVVVTERKAAK